MTDCVGWQAGGTTVLHRGCNVDVARGVSARPAAGLVPGRTGDGVALELRTSPEEYVLCTLCLIGTRPSALIHATHIEIEYAGKLVQRFELPRGTFATSPFSQLSPPSPYLHRSARQLILK